MVPGYRPQLDALRAIAVSLVLLQHFWPDLHPVVWHLGHQGVRLFFVLSGFLITGLLLSARARAQADGGGRGRALGRFYVRRFWRLLPAYYAMLGLALLLDAEGIRGSDPWHLAHLSNLYFAAHATWDPWVANHFWSLAVEEQFYLAWPLLLMALPARALVPVAWAGVAAGPLFRLAGALLGWNDMAMLGLLPASLDALGAGCLLALAGGRLPAWRGLPPGAWAAAAWALLAAALVLPLAGGAGVAGAVLPDLLALPALAWTVARGAMGFGGAAGRLLEHPWPVGLGRISYGVYLWHPLVLWAAGRLGEATGLYGRASGLWALLLLAPLSVLVAALSWRLLERPLLRLRDRGNAGPANDPVSGPAPPLPGGDPPRPGARPA